MSRAGHRKFNAEGNFKAKFERLAEVFGVEAAQARSVDRKKPCQDEISGKPKIEGREQEAKSRFIPSELRERVYERAGHQCQFSARFG